MTDSAKNKNLEFFKKELSELLNNVAYKGKFVVIHDGKIEGVQDSFDSALVLALSKFQPNEFIVQQVIDENDQVNFLLSAVA